MSKEIAVYLSREEAEAVLYCINYASEHDDEGIRSSEPEAEARTAAIDGALLEITAALEQEEQP